jgi:parallel beta-helix repeat protein
MANNVEVRNNDLRECASGIFFEDYSGGNDIPNANNIVHNNKISTKWSGLYLLRAYNNTLYDNVIIGASAGILVNLGSNYNVFRNNTLINNSWGIEIHDQSFPVAPTTKNMFYGNKIIDSVVANTDDESNGNYWNNSEIGNYWSDFESNPGYPNYYEIEGPGDGVDNRPIWDLDDDGYNIWEDCDDSNSRIHIGCKNKRTKVKPELRYGLGLPLFSINFLYVWIKDLFD